MSWLSKSVKGASKGAKPVFKKTVRVGAAAAGGFLGGGVIGAVGAAARETVRQTSSGKGKAFTARSGYQSVVTGAVVNVAAAGFAKVGAAVAAKGGVSAVTKTAAAKTSAFSKGGGLTKVLGGFAKKAFTTQNVAGLTNTLLNKARNAGIMPPSVEEQLQGDLETLKKTGPQTALRWLDRKNNPETDDPQGAGFSDEELARNNSPLKWLVPVGVGALLLLS